MKIEEVLKIIKPALNNRWKYVAMDEMGYWFLYETKPKIIDNKFVGLPYCVLNLSGLFKIDKAKNWKKSLIKIEDIQ